MKNFVVPSTLSSLDMRVDGNFKIKSFEYFCGFKAKSKDARAGNTSVLIHR
jgi:hypothetical protein